MAGTTESNDSTAKIVVDAVETQVEGADAADGPDQCPESPGVLVFVSAMGGVMITLTDEAQAGLHAVDYIVWALQRPFERNEERYVTNLWPAFLLVQDFDDRRKAGDGVFNTQKKPLNAVALAWLEEKKMPGI